MSAETWNDLHRQQPWGRWPPESIVAYFCRTFPQDRRRIRVLDLGCGAGACTRMLVDEGFAVVAIDCSEHAIQQVRYGLRKWELPHCETVVGDITQRLPFKDASFNVVLDNLTLCHVEDDQRVNVMNEVHRVLIDGGTFLTRRFASHSASISGRGYVRYFPAEFLPDSDLFKVADRWSESINDIAIYGGVFTK